MEKRSGGRSNPDIEKGDAMKYFAKLYRKLVDYLNDSGDLTTGSHRGQPQSLSLYSILYPVDRDNRR